MVGTSTHLTQAPIHLPVIVVHRLLTAAEVAVVVSEYNFSDPLIGEMVHRDHFPRELYHEIEESKKRLMIAIHCNCCGNSWPCSAIIRVREWEDNRPHLKVVSDV